MKAALPLVNGNTEQLVGLASPTYNFERTSDPAVFHLNVLKLYQIFPTANQFVYGS